jgi:hypothetical protein
MFQLKLNDIELVSKPEYYREYIIAIIGDRRMLETEGCAPVAAQREDQHPQPYRPRADDPGRLSPDYRFKFVRSFSYLRHGGRLPRLPSFVERVPLLPQVKLVLHLGCNPHDRNSKFFLLDGLARANNDLPRIVHSTEQHGHFRRPWSKLCRAFFDQHRELLRRSLGFSHAAGSLIGNVSLAQRNARVG